MNVAQGQIVIAFAQLFQVYRVDAPHDIFCALVVTQEIATFHRGVSGHHHRQSFYIHGSRFVEQLLEESFWKISLVDIWDGNDVAFSRHFNDMLINVFLLQLSDGINIQCSPRCSEYLVFRAAVVVTGGHHDNHLGISLVYFHECF